MPVRFTPPLRTLPSTSYAMLEYLPLVGLLGYAFYKWVTCNDDYFAKRNLPFLKPTFLLGTNGVVMLKLQRMDEWARRLYNAHPMAR